MLLLSSLFIGRAELQSRRDRDILLPLGHSINDHNGADELKWKGKNNKIVIGLTITNSTEHSRKGRKEAPGISVTRSPALE